VFFLAGSPPLTSEPVPIAAQLGGVLVHARDKEGKEKGKQRLDKGEFVEEIVVPLLELEGRLNELGKHGVVMIDPRVWTFAMGMKAAMELGLGKL